MKNKDMVIISRILEYCDEIEETHIFFSNNRELFCDKRRGFLYRNAITMPILQIGELAKNLSEDFRKDHAEIPWKSVTGIRDIFAHHYGSIDFPSIGFKPPAFSRSAFSSIFCGKGVNCMMR